MGMKLVDAIANIEGFYAVIPSGGKPNRPQRNNNPGDLEFHSWMHQKYGALLESGTLQPRFAYFPSVKIGFQALTDILQEDYAHLSIYAAINKYAPPNENDDTNYVTYVCKRVGCLTSDLVGTILARDAAAELEQNNG